jgi:hypothetical protein
LSKFETLQMAQTYITALNDLLQWLKVCMTCGCKPLGLQLESSAEIASTWYGTLWRPCNY